MRACFAFFAQAGRSPRRQIKAVSPLRGGMRVAVVGCAHGELDVLYRAVQEAETVAGPVDLVLCPGDFQAVRNASDLACMACPDRFRVMNSFWRYYNGDKRAPYPTVFVGGNHEAPNHLQELKYGGLVAPNMYYLGDAGVINVRGLRIAGVSGVYVEHHYNIPRKEAPPYPRNEVKSVYHARSEDIRRLSRLSRGSVDIMLSHDWPRDIAFSGDTNDLLRKKPFLRKEVERSDLGHPGTKELLSKMQPRYWFAAHMHVKFAAEVRHDSGSSTRFLALDKILPKRDFLQILEIPVEDDPSRVMFEPKTVAAENDDHLFELDLEWLSILHSEAKANESLIDPVSNEDIDELKSRVSETDFQTVCRSVSDFERNSAIHNPSGKGRSSRPTSLKYPKWTREIAGMLDVKLPGESIKSVDEIDKTDGAPETNGDPEECCEDENRRKVVEVGESANKRQKITI